MNVLPQRLGEQGGPIRSVRQPLAGTRWVRDQAEPTPSSDAIFWRLLVDYRRHGGLAREREVLGRLPATDRAVTACRAAPLRFEWSGDTWLSWAQFIDRTDLLHPGVAAVVAELQPAFNGWDCTRWFVEPNGWLNYRRPLDVLGAEPDVVTEAARADRYVAAG
jgi:hypothetical protein